MKLCLFPRMLMWVTPPWYSGHVNCELDPQDASTHTWRDPARPLTRHLSHAARPRSAMESTGSGGGAGTDAGEYGFAVSVCIVYRMTLYTATWGAHYCAACVSVAEQSTRR